MTLPPLRRCTWRLVGVATSWHLTSQQAAERNALVATTALLQRRAERLAVEEYLAELAVRRTAPTTVVPARTRTA